MPNRNSKILFLLAGLFLCITLKSQDNRPPHFLEPADSFDRTRFWVAAGTGTTLYTATTIGLYNAWYKEYELTGFHTFDDFGQWHHVDKLGHMLTTHAYCTVGFKGALWTGMSRRAAMWTAAGGSMFLQSTVEVFDAFSAKWGFSWSDMAFNALGAGLFVGQELLWGEQRILMKFSNTRPTYSSTSIHSTDGGAVSSPRARAFDLYGSSYWAAFLKDYNGSTNWFSINPSAFILPRRPDTGFPKWLNIALGYGAENMYGGYENRWTDEGGNEFWLEDPPFERYQQFYLSLDIDLTRIRTRSRFLKTLFAITNWIKIPSPTVEFNTQGQVKLHPLFW